MAIKKFNLYSETGVSSHMLQCSLPANIRRANHIAVAAYDCQLEYHQRRAAAASRGDSVVLPLIRRKVPRDVHKCATIHIVYRIANPICHNSHTIITQITYCTDCMLLLQIPKIVRCNVADIRNEKASSFNFSEI